ncbi:MAG: ATP-binding protein [Gemmatimonadetes bacterium]|nr:ATP-binding protein [Gemmatimonadota bacterium]
MNDQTLHDQYGLRHNPFLPGLPGEALWEPPEFNHFAAGVDTLVLVGGFALVTGEPGIGKSKVLHLLARRLEDRGDVMVGVMERPQSRLSDFYREMGQIFGVDLSPSNRYGGFKALRSRWGHHIRSSLVRPVLLIDEVQQTPVECLDELRILSSTAFDSHCLLSVVLAGDMRLSERLRSPDLMSLNSRVRVRLDLRPWNVQTLRAFTRHLLEQAGAPHLMTDGVVHALAEHAEGNLRRLVHAGELLLAVAASRNLPQVDENLFVEVFSRGPVGAVSPPARRVAG